MSDSICVRATASVANVSCGFDCIGYAICAPCDAVRIRPVPGDEIRIEMRGRHGDGIPVHPQNNTAGAAMLSLLEARQLRRGFEVVIEKGIAAGGGMGSSAASAAAAVVGLNQILGEPLALAELLPHAMVGEAAASGGFHADNVAPALLGGMVLIRDYDPLDIVPVPLPEGLHSTVVAPQFVINTRDARGHLPGTVEIKTAVSQAGNLAGFVLAMAGGDFALMGRAMVDHFAEPARAQLIPGYSAVRAAAMDSGVIGCGISGSGPTMFALSASREVAEGAADAMRAAFRSHGLASTAYSGPICCQPPQVLD